MKSRTKVKSTGATAATGRERVRAKDRRDVADALVWAVDLVVAMIARERVDTAYQPKETRDRVRRETSIEARLLAEVDRLKSIDELALLPEAELVGMRRKLGDRTQERARELLEGLGAPMRMQRRPRAVAAARAKMLPLADLPADLHGRKLAKILPELEAKLREIEAIDCTPGLDVARQMNETLMANVREFVRELGDDVPRIGNVSKTTIGRAAGINYQADRDVAREVDRAEETAGLYVSFRPLDPRLFR